MCSSIERQIADNPPMSLARMILVIALLALSLGSACRKRGTDPALVNKTAVADTCKTAARTRDACKRCCPEAGGWQFSPTTGCVCFVPVRCSGGDKDLSACGTCCERQGSRGQVLVGPVFDTRRGCSCQYL
jgi:hypothetical protein